MPPAYNVPESKPLDLSGAARTVSVIKGMVPKPSTEPWVEIIEQPAAKKHRFRYEREVRSIGSITGVNSTPEKKTYPTIKIHNHIGKVTVLVSCVTKDEPYRPHPHKLVDKERRHSTSGICCFKCDVTRDSNEFQMKDFGVQCVKISEITDSLRVRQQLNVDPFKTGFSYMEDARSSIDLNAIRLCFQVFLPDTKGQRLKPVVSNVVYDKKALSELHIVKLSPGSGTVRGGTEVILLCEKVTRDDEVVFFLEKNNVVVWEKKAEITLVHKQIAIVVTTPFFGDPRTKEYVTVHIQLRRLSDSKHKIRSNSVPFVYIPDCQDIMPIQRPLEHQLNEDQLLRRNIQVGQPVFASRSTPPSPPSHMPHNIHPPPPIHMPHNIPPSPPRHMSHNIPPSPPRHMSHNIPPSPPTHMAHNIPPSPPRHMPHNMPPISRYYPGHISPQPSIGPPVIYFPVIRKKYYPGWTPSPRDKPYASIPNYANDW